MVITVVITREQAPLGREHLGPEEGDAAAQLHHGADVTAASFEDLFRFHEVRNGAGGVRAAPPVARAAAGGGAPRNDSDCDCVGLDACCYRRRRDLPYESENAWHHKGITFGPDFCTTNTPHSHNAELQGYRAVQSLSKNMLQSGCSSRDHSKAC